MHFVEFIRVNIPRELVELGGKFSENLLKSFTRGCRASTRFCGENHSAVTITDIFNVACNRLMGIIPSIFRK